MNPLAALIAASVAFVGSHLLMSHPLRAGLVSRLGEGGFSGAYTLVSFVTFGWMIVAAWAIPPEAPLWMAPDWLWHALAGVMWIASVLLIGSLFNNPALPVPGAAAMAIKPPLGVFAITRHPMMWSFALWSLVHGAVWPTPSVLVVTLAILVLALGGAAGQDVKKARLMGPAWRAWVSHTGFVPFTGPARWAAMWPGWAVLAAGTALWLLASWAHVGLGAPAVGVWR